MERAGAGVRQCPLVAAQRQLELSDLRVRLPQPPSLRAVDLDDDDVLVVEVHVEPSGGGGRDVHVDRGVEPKRALRRQHLHSSRLGSGCSPYPFLQNLEILGFLGFMHDLFDCYLILSYF